MVGQQVLHRVGRFFRVESTIIVMVVTFLLPMQRRVFAFGDGIESRTRMCQSERLPEHGQQKDNSDHGAVHGCESNRHEISLAVVTKITCMRSCGIA